MTKTTRRNLLKVAAAGGVSAALGVATKTETRAQQSPDDEHSHGGQSKPVSGPLAQATVSFGQYPADSRVDRMRVANPGALNVHELIPHEVKIQAGGTVDFVIQGFHQILVYDNGTQPGDINVAAAPPAVPPGNPSLAILIDDPNRRIYRGLSPIAVPANLYGAGFPANPIAAAPQERTEAVNFPNPGTFLVLCGVRPHFKNPVTGEFDMFGFVTVLP